MDNQLILIILVCLVFGVYVWLKEFFIKKAEKRLAKRLGIDESLAKIIVSELYNLILKD
jgi:hypothetical protein